MDENLESQNPAPSAPSENSFENENPESVSPYNNPQNSFTPTRKRSPKKFLYILGAVLIALIALNIFRAVGSKNKSTPTPTPTPNISLETPSPSPTASETPTPTPEPTKKPVNSIDATTGLDRAKLSVSVQNGSGVTGAAAKASDLLKSLGYNVISVGNADNSDFTNVTIKVKSSQQSYLPVLNKDLSSNSYSVGSSSADLTATASADALVIIGK